MKEKEIVEKLTKITTNISELENLHMYLENSLKNNIVVDDKIIEENNIIKAKNDIEEVLFKIQRELIPNINDIK